MKNSNTNTHVNAATQAESIIEKFPKEVRHIIEKLPLNEIESSFGFLLNDKPNEYFESCFKNLKEHNPKPTYDFNSTLDVSKIVPFSIQKQEDESMGKGNLYVYQITEQVFHEAITLSYLFILEYEHYHKMFVFHTDYNFDFYIIKIAYKFYTLFFLSYNHLFVQIILIQYQQFVHLNRLLILLIVQMLMFDKKQDFLHYNHP